MQDITYLLEQSKDYISLILKLFQAPSIEYYRVVLNLIKDEEVLESSHLLEMIDMVYATSLEKLKELDLKITYKLVYEEMSFREACRKYYREAMQILDEEENVKSMTKVRIPIYKKRF